jgi:hypothetical protein
VEAKTEQCYECGKWVTDTEWVTNWCSCSECFDKHLQENEKLWTSVNIEGLLSIVTVGLLLYLSYRFEFRMKNWYRGLKCRKTDHKWVTVYSYTQQCRHCHKVEDISKEVWSR